MMNRFLKGAGYLFEGLKMPVTKHPRLLPYMVIPAAINTLLFATVGWVLWSYGGALVETLQAMVAGDHAWYLAWLVWLLEVLMWAVIATLAFALAFVVVYLLGNVLASPFNDLLSQAVEDIRLGKIDEPFSLKGVIADAGFTVGQELRRLVFFVIVTAALLLLHLVPVVGSMLNAVLTPLFAIFFVALEYMDLPMARRRFRFRTRLGALWSNRAVGAGFGAATAALLCVPLLNFVCIPVAVVGGTLLYSDLVEQGRLPRSAQGLQTPASAEDSA